MKIVELYLRVRQSVIVEGRSRRETARLFGIARKTVDKMCAFSAPPGYRRRSPAAKPKLDGFTGIIDQILADDQRMPAKQKHTAKRIFERLRDEYGFAGHYTIVKSYIHDRQVSAKEMFVPLHHPAGHAQVDFGEGLIGGVARKLHFFCMDLPHSDAIFVKAYPAETTEAFLDGHVAAFDFFGKLPLSILYDNTALAVAAILGDGRRKRTRAFTELQSHYLFEDRFGRPGKGNDKGKVEGLVGYARRNFMVPMPDVASFEDLNSRLATQCLERRREVLRGHSQTIDERLAEDLMACRSLPTVPFDPCDQRPGRVSSISLVRYRGNDYSVPTRYGHREVQVKGYVDTVVMPARSSRGTSAPISAATSCLIHCTTWLCWSARPWIRPRRSRACPRCLPSFDACWRLVWRSRAGGSSFRCCACWRYFPWPRWRRRSRMPSTVAPLALMRSNC